MSAAPQLDRLAAARRALAEASSVAGVPLSRSGVRARHAVVPTGIAPLDEALGGGLPRGRIVEVVGPRSSGRLSLTLTLLSSALRTGEPVALIDAADALDPRALHPDATRDHHPATTTPLRTFAARIASRYGSP